MGDDGRRKKKENTRAQGQKNHLVHGRTEATATHRTSPITGPEHRIQRRVAGHMP